MPEELKIVTRPAQLEDCKDIFCWRSDPQSKAMSLSNYIPSYREHQDWFKASLTNINCQLYIGEIDAYKIGICRFDYNKSNSTAEVSINMNPTRRGLGLAKRFLALCIEQYYLTQYCTLLANIKPKNEASLRIFKGLGFKPSSKTINVMTLLKPSEPFYFRKISENDSEMLFDLLVRRAHSISHKNIPTKEEHYAFVRSYPYRAWYMVLKDNEPIGSVYLQNNNSIGLNVLDPSPFIISKILSFISKNFEPKKEVKSLVPPYFYINVPYSNTKLHETLHKLEASPIQVSYKI